MADGVGSAANGYRKRADALRAEAEAITNPQTKLALLNIASNYEQLANTMDANDRRHPHLRLG